MAMQALSNGGFVSIERCVCKGPILASAIQQRRKRMLPPLFLCKTDTSNVKVAGLSNDLAGFQTWKQRNNGVISFPSVFTDGLLCAKSTNASPPNPTGENLDEWMEESVIEIVRHIQEAPFLHYVFDKNSPSTRLKRHRVSENRVEGSDCWPMTRNSIRDVSPVGIILVQRLGQDSMCRYCSVQTPESEERLPCNGKEGKSLDERGCTDIWGLVIQGRSPGSSACYILKTTQIASGNGFCTQFCLTKVKCFGPSPQIQFTNSWLL